MIDLPLVTIAIPTYNHARVIGEALRSAMTQTYGNVEILVLDNASTDETPRVVAAIAGVDPRVRYVRHEANIGMAGNFNACINAARGEYVKFLCADDVLMPDCVSAMVEAFASRSDLSLVACARLLVDEKLAPLRIARFSARSMEFSGPAAVHKCFFRGNLIGEPTAVMFRKRDAGRGFREEYRQAMDLEMWIHLLQTGALRYIAQPLCKVRQHSWQATQAHIKSGVVLQDKRRMFRELKEVVGNASTSDKLSWDIRMAVTMIRTKRAGHVAPEGAADDTYFHFAFNWLTYPVAWILWFFAIRLRTLFLPDAAPY